MRAIELKGAGFAAEGRKLLSGISFSVEQGEFVCLLGANGAGKSTLTKLLNGLNRATEGQVTVMGMDTRKSRVSALARQVGYLFQNPDRMLSLDSVRAELAFGLKLMGATQAEADARTDETAALFGLDPAMNPLTAGRGQRQLTALAAVVAPRPGLLVLDEPTTGLDYRECMLIMSAVERLRAETGATVFMVTHDMELAWEFGSRALVLEGGKLIADGPVDEVMRDTRTLERARLRTAQIPELAAQLGGEFSRARTCGDVLATIKRLKGLQ